MKQLHISPDLSLPVDAATQTFAFIARKGAGKTYAAGKLVELLLGADVQVVVLDNVGNWYGLRLSADGKGKGFDVPVFGGLRGDLPLEASAGELVADVAVDTGRSLILDVSQFSLGDRKRFATAFGERLWKKKKAEAHPSPLMLVIEESQLIIPQFTGRGGDDARMVGIYEEIIRLGRNYGIGCTMISQRPQSVNKEVLNQTECLFVLQVNGSQERKALKEWISHQGMDTNLVDELPSLPVGTAYVWSPQWLQILKKVRIGEKTTFDASSTPKVGEKSVRRDPAPLDLAEIQTRMAAVVERAKADDPRSLRAKIASLSSELAKLSAQKPPKAVEVKTVERPVLKDGQLARVEQLLARGDKLVQAIQTFSPSLTAPLGEIRDCLRKLTQPIPAAVAARVVPVVTARPVNTVKQRPVISKSVDGVNGVSGSALPKGEKNILTAIAQNPSGASKQTLTILTGYKRSSRDTYIQRLRERGYIVEHQSGEISATPEGVQSLGNEFKRLPTGDALREHWVGKLTGGEKVVLEALIAVYPDFMRREQIDEATGYKRSSRDTYLQRLSGRRLIEFTKDGEAVASDMLFD